MRDVAHTRNEMRHLPDNNAVLESDMKQTYVRWTLESVDLIDLTPAKARDLITRCLLEAHKETFAQNEQRLAHNSTEADIHVIVEGAVRLAFREASEDYENPSATGLMKVVEVLARKSASSGTPSEVIEHHKRQIDRVLQHLGALERLR